MQEMVKKYIRLLVSGALLCLGALAVYAGVTAPAPQDTARAPASADYKVIAYYLYVLPRCQTCLNIEAYSKEAVETAFAAELEQGIIEWHAYDTGVPEFEHFWYDFELETKSLVIAAVQDGKQLRWKTCEKVWDLVEDKPAFQKYVQDEVRAYLP